MGGSTSCCFKSVSSKHESTHSSYTTKQSPPTNEQSDVEAAYSQPADLSLLNDKPKSEQRMTIPRYPVLPSIEANKKPISACSNGNTLAQGDSSSIMNLYNRYVDPELGYISAEGIERLCNDLELSPEDFKILVLAYALGAQVMCRFTEDEFVQGCKKLNIVDIPSMKSTIPGLLESVKGNAFAPFYRWTYKFALDTENGQRTLPTDLAISLWELVFTQNVPALLDKWLRYLESSSVRGISKDTWDMYLIFVDQIKGDLLLYDDTEAWPSLLDEFVEYELSKQTDAQV